MLELPTLNCSIVIVCPELSIETKKARELLDKPYKLEKVVEHSAYLAATISALYTNDLDLLSSSLKDVLIEPRRAQLITGFYEVQRSAYSVGAIACGISGSGPAMFAIVKADDDSSMVAKSMQQEFKNFGLKSDSWVSCMSKRGAFVISKN
jgi:homoserine kinase